MKESKKQQMIALLISIGKDGHLYGNELQWENLKKLKRIRDRTMLASFQNWHQIVDTLSLQHAVWLCKGLILFRSFMGVKGGSVEWAIPVIKGIKGKWGIHGFDLPDSEYSQLANWVRYNTTNYWLLREI